MIKKTRKSNGNISEFGAVLVIVVPILLLCLFGGYELAYGYLIKSNLDNAAKNAARAVAIAYGQDKTILTNHSKQQDVFTPIRIPNFVNDNAQFADPLFKPAGSDPTSVTVSVAYKSGQFGLPKYPNPDILNLSPSLNIAGTYTYRLENE